jgi:CheY-specific phosphatase CheX
LCFQYIAWKKGGGTGFGSAMISTPSPSDRRFCDDVIKRSLGGLRLELEHMEIQGVSGDNIRNSVLLPFINETISNLKTMAGLKASSDLLTYREPLDVFTFKAFAVAITTTFTNGVTNNIVMNVDLDTALAVGNRVRAAMLGESTEIATLNDEIREVLAEFLNTVIGLATREVNETNHKIEFSPPLYLYNEEDTEFLLQGVKQIMTVPIDIENVGKFHLSYLVRG